MIQADGCYVAAPWGYSDGMPELAVDLHRCAGRCSVPRLPRLKPERKISLSPKPHMVVSINGGPQI